MTAAVKIYGLQKAFIKDTGSPISKLPADKNMLKTEIQEVRRQYQDLNKSEVIFCGKIPANVEFENNKQNM